jgi:hypothetical protein
MTTATTTTTTTHACARCGKAQDSRRLPRGWKVIAGEVVCDACLKDGWCVRSVTLPVARVLGRQDAGPTSRPEPVEGFLRHFLPAWRMATDLANWAMQEIVRRDVRRTPDMETLPAYSARSMWGTFPRRLKRVGAPVEQVGTLYDYWNRNAPSEFRRAWDGAAGSASAVLKQVEDTWKHHSRFGRWAVLWKGEARPMVHRFPCAFPVRKQDWRGWWQDRPGGRAAAVSVTLPGGRYLLELDRSPELRGQLADFARLLSGEATPGDLKLVPVERGGRLVGAKVTLTGRFPRAARGEGPAAVIRTAPDALLVVEVEGRPPWVLYCDHLKRVVGQYETWLERSRVDLKHEKRWPAAKRRRWVRRREPAVARHRGRIDSENKQAARAAANYVLRQGCSAAVYNDSERSYLPSWPWAALRERIRCILAEGGVSFQTVTASHDSAEEGQ